MQSNSNDNSQSWKQRLDTFEETENVDLNAAWLKLQQQTLPRKSSSKRGWYWLAAACLAGLTFLLVNNNGEKFQTPGFVRIDSNRVQPETAHFIIKNEPLVFENNEIVRAGSKKSSSKPAQVLLQKEEPLELLVTQPAGIKEPAVFIDTSRQAAIAVVVPVKKMKVVHINELNPAGNNNGFTKQEGKPYYPLSYKAKDAYGNANGNRPRNDRDNILKIKLFP